MCVRLNTPPSSISNRKRPKRESEGTVDLRGVTAVGDASPQNLQTVATDLLRLPYPALDHFHPLRGPAKTLDRRQLRVRRGTKWTLFRKTTRRGRYTLLTPSWRVCIHLSHIKETTSEQLLKKQLNVLVRMPISSCNVLLSGEKNVDFMLKNKRKKKGGKNK